MKKINLILFCVGLCLFTASCYQMRSKNFPGKRILLKDEDKGKEISLHFEKKTFNVKFVDKDNAVIAYLKWNDTKNDYEVVSKKLILSELDGYKFLNVKVDENFVVLKYLPSNDKQMYVIYTISFDKVRQDIADGKIKAEIDGYHIIFDTSKEEFDKYLSENMSTVFDYDHPGVLTVIQDK